MKQEDGTSRTLLKDREPQGQENAPAPRRRSVRIQAVVAIIMLLCIIVGGFLIVKGNSPSSPGNNTASAPTALPKPWCQPPSGFSDGFTGIAISGRSTNDVWSLGAQGQVMDWDGHQWGTMYTSSSTQNTFRSILEIAPNNVWVVGEQLTNGLASHPLLIHWGGTGWQTVKAPDASPGGKNSVAAVSGTSPNDIWIVGFYVPQGPTGVLAEHWDGTQWSVESPSDAPSGAQFTSVKALASNDVWATGYVSTTVSGQTVNEPLAEHWDGSKWTNVTTPSLASLGGGIIYGISGSSATDVWAVGSLKNGNMLTEHWDGKSWSQIVSPSVYQNSNNWLASVADLGPNNVWAVGRVAVSADKFQAYIQHWDGQQWITTPDPDTSAGELDVVTTIGSQFWIVGIPNTSGGHAFVETICS